MRLQKYLRFQIKVNELKVGAILSYLSIGITMVIALLYTPIMLRYLGQSEYGLYSLIASVIGYLSILDLGLGNAIIRYISRNRAFGDRIEESKLNGMFMILYILIGFLTLIIGTIIYSNLDSILGDSLSSSELHKAKVMTIFLVLNFSLSFPLSIFSSVMQAYEKFTIAKIIFIIRLVLFPCISLPFLLNGFGAVTLVAITTLINLLSLIFNVYYCFKFLNISFSYKDFNYKLIGEILGYSFFIFLTVIVDKIYWNTQQIVLGIVSGTIAVAIYALAMQFINLFILFSTSVSGLFLPRVSIMVANNATENDLTKMMIKFGRLQLIILGYMVSSFYLFGQPFINYWAGNNYKEAYYIILLIIVPLTIPLIQNIGISILQAKNMHGFRAIILIIIATLNIIFSIPLAKNYSGIGSALAITISLILGNVIAMNIYYHKKIGLNMVLFWRNITSLSIPIFVSVLIGYVVNVAIASSEIYLILCSAIIFSLVYLVTMYSFGLNQYEKQIFSSVIKKTRIFNK